MDGEVDLAAQERVLDFLDEQPLAAGFRQRRVLQPIAAGLDDDDLGARRRARSMRAATVLRLPQRELAAARAERASGVTVVTVRTPLSRPDRPAGPLVAVLGRG